MGRRWRAVQRVFELAAALCLGLAMLLPLAGSALAQEGLTPEEALVARFAPVVMLQRQAFPCDEAGEPYQPAPVDVVFGDPAVVLREGPDQVEVKSPVEDADLFDLGGEFATDLPGSPRDPGCDYETHFKQVMGDRPPVVYAHIATEEGRPGLALQYWIFYYFNDFNNKHEGDWEMVQLRFAADSAAEALTQEPVQVAYAQHEGGETAAWDAPKLEREGDRPVVYPSRGSHASYYGPGLWLGWGQDGSGLGCDIATGEPVRIDPEVRLIPATVGGPDDPFAWVTFAGRWGERDVWFYNGPTGPSQKPRWTAPLTWMDGLRADSIRVSAAAVIGPAPTDIFCGAVQNASDLLTLSKPYPLLIAGVVAAGLGLAVWAVWQSWSALSTTWRVYRAHLPLFAALGAITIPVTLIVSALHYLLATSPGFVAATGLSEDSPGLLTGLSVVALLQRLLLLLIVAPAIVVAVGDIAAGRPSAVGRSLREGIAKLPNLVWTLARGALVVLALTITVIGIPWAVNREVRWMFGPQAAILGETRGKLALDASATAVRGRWWQAAANGATLAFIGAAPGVIVGLALLILARFPVDAANSVASLVYAIAQPFAIAGLTLLYLGWRTGGDRVAG